MKITGATFHGTYESARGVARISSGIGWVVVIVGGTIVLASLPFIQQLGVLGVASGMLITIGGLLQVAVGQGVRAAVDGADYARQSLKLQIAQAEGRTEVELRTTAMKPSLPRGSSAGLPAAGSLNEHEFVALDPRSARAYIEQMRTQGLWQETDALLSAWYRTHKTNLDNINTA